ncbi:MAG: 16S rRNA (cytidine(1402)-2'-O)-methyltransferase [Lentisphaeria bacterium]|nr:16S rRNA (cytidine(1402)-2'-O)-methyltransferase [Lentisphaeria bacterium]
MATLYIVATPIGNLSDITLRALKVLGEVGVLACEDTRRTGVLLHCHGLGRPALMFSYHEHNEDRAAARLVAALEGGEDVALCSNAGYPGISDPGYVAVCRALEAGHRVEVIPGAGSVQVALLASGLPPSSYVFKGFPPRKEGRRRAFLALERDLPHTLVILESPQRLGRLLAEALEVLGDRRGAVCLELTKQFERVHRGWLSELTQTYAATAPKGEAVIVIAGNHPKFVRNPPPPSATVPPTPGETHP